MKRLIGITLILAVVLSSVIGGNRVIRVSGTPETAKAAETGKYISKIVISNQSDKQAAEMELGDEYTVLDTDFGKSADTHAWIGFATTDDPGQAITDIKVMDMYGDFNYSDYQELLEKQKAVVEDQMSILLPAVKEYAKNYDAGTVAAISMYTALNYYYEDDSKKGMGDYLLDAGRALISDPKNNTVLDDLKKVFMQASDLAVQTIETILMQAQGSRLKKDGSWMSRLCELGPDGLEQEYKTAYPKLSKRALDKAMKDDLDDDAKMILNELPSLREYLKEFEATELAQAVESNDVDSIEKILDVASDEEVADVDESMDPEEAAKVVADSLDATLKTADGTSDVMDAMLMIHMKEMQYGESSVYDFIMREDLTVRDLYPMAYLLSAGQKSLIQDVGLYSLFAGVISGDSEEPGESEGEAVPTEASVSIYDGVDREAFEGDTAITGSAMNRIATTDDDVPLIKNETYNMGVVMAIVVSAVSFVIAANCKPKYSTKTKLYANRYYTALESLKFNANTTIVDLEIKLDVTERNIRSQGMLEIQNKYNVNLSAEIADPTWENYNKALGKLSENQRAAVNKSIGARVENELTKARTVTENKIAKVNQKSLAKQDALLKQSRAGARWGARIVGILAGVLAVAMVAYEIYDMVKKDKTVSYSDKDMPFFMVDRTYSEGSESITYITYEVCTDISEKKADLRNWKGKNGWLTVYTTTDTAVGDPILAQEFGIRKEKTTSDINLIGVSEFGSKDVYSFSDSTYLFFRPDNGTASDDEEVAEVTEKTEDAEETAEPVTADAASGDAADVDNTESSAFGGSTLWVILIMLLVALLAAGGGVWYRKRKEKV